MFSAAANIFTTYMPGAIAKHVPGNNATLNAELYAAPAVYGRVVSLRMHVITDEA